MHTTRSNHTPLGRLETLLVALVTEPNPPSSILIDIREAHEQVLRQCRSHNLPMPAWERFPVARNYFTQRDGEGYALSHRSVAYEERTTSH